MYPDGVTSVDMENPGGQGGSKVRLRNKYDIMNANGQKCTHPIIIYDSCLGYLKLMFRHSLN